MGGGGGNEATCSGDFLPFRTNDSTNVAGAISAGACHTTISRRPSACGMSVGYVPPGGSSLLTRLKAGEGDLPAEVEKISPCYFVHGSVKPGGRNSKIG